MKNYDLNDNDYNAIDNWNSDCYGKYHVDYNGVWYKDED